MSVVSTTTRSEVEKIKSEFITIASHRMKNPMAAIKWYAESLLKGDLGALSKQQKSFIKQIFLCNRRLINFLDDLLRVVRVEEGKIKLEKRFFNFNSLVQEIIVKMNDEIERKKISIQYNGKNFKIFADVDKVGQVLFDLLDNAIKYNSVGGKVKITVKKERSSLFCSIADEGVGIPENQLDRIFTKFFRANNIITMHTEGNGLSLYLARAYVESHGGKIWAKSKLGEGSTFCFMLPIK